MTKNEVMAEVAKKAGLSKIDASKSVDAFVEVVTTTLKKGGDIRLVGFGTFKVTKRAASVGHNPRTGEKIKIAACKQPKFTAGKGLKDAVNK